MSFTSKEISTALKKLEQNIPKDSNKDDIKSFQKMIRNSNVSELQSIKNKLSKKSGYGQRKLDPGDKWKKQYVSWYIHYKQRDEMKNKQTGKNKLQEIIREIIREELEKELLFRKNNLY